MIDDEDGKRRGAVFGAEAMTTEPFRPRVLDRLSVHDLELYIAEMTKEIERVQRAIAAKKAATAAAASVFKT